jgi:hypothetical protein
LKPTAHRGYLADWGVAPVEAKLILALLLINLPPVDSDRSLCNFTTLSFPFDRDYGWQSGIFLENFL